MSQLGERKRAKYGHTLCNDIRLDKCHISAFVACKDILKHTLNSQWITASWEKKEQRSDLFENVLKKLACSLI